MKVESWLKQAEDALKNQAIATARLDSLVLLEDNLGIDRAQLLAHPEMELTHDQENRLNKQIALRAKHEPLAYIRGKSEFYGREFMIDHRVLEPRPESEMIIDILKGLKLPAKPVIADIGTGSGMLAITAKLELPAAKLYAVDIDENCLDVARENAQKHAVNVSFFHGDLLEPLQDTKIDVLLCNLPYVPDNFQINPAAMREPRIAIFGGMDGLNVYRKLFEQIDSLHTQPTHILTESLPPQHHFLAEIARKHHYIQQTKQDFIQLFLLG